MTDNQNSIVIFTKASQMLAEADTIQKAKELKSLALTAADWAKRKGMGEQAIRYARSYALEAERKMGEMLLETDRQGPGQYKRLHDVTVQPTLAEIGVTKRESAEAQQLASLPIDEFNEVKTGKKTRAAIKRDIKIKEYKERISQPIIISNDIKPNLILADPPWQYEFAETDNRKIENQYQTVSVEEIGTHLPDVDDNCLLLLWATAPKLREAMQLLDLWGFIYKTHAIWDKKKIGMGYWFRGRHELLIIATKGQVSPPLPEYRVASVFEEERTAHSSKPECVYEWIENTFAHLNKMEMYARSIRPGWIAWGNEV